MTINIKISTVIVAALISQTSLNFGPQGIADDAAAAARVATLSARLHVRDDDPADKRRYYAEMREVTNNLRQEIDAYVTKSLLPAQGGASAGARLSAVLKSHRPNPEYGDPPFASVDDLRDGRSLVLAYTLVRPPHHDSATIRAYRATLNHFDLVATTGEADFDGFGMFKRQMKSPIAGECWLVAWGQAHTYNGAKVRFRLYAFDGTSFRTIWAPDDMLSARITFAASGFTIDHEIKREPYQLHDEYVLSADGPLKVR